MTEAGKNSEVKGQTWLLSIPRGRLNLPPSSPSIDQWHLSLHPETWVSLLHSEPLGALSPLLQHCCCFRQQTVNPNKQILILKHVVC